MQDENCESTQIESRIVDEKFTSEREATFRSISSSSLLLFTAVCDMISSSSEIFSTHVEIVIWTLRENGSVKGSVFHSNFTFSTHIQRARNSSSSSLRLWAMKYLHHRLRLFLCTATQCDMSESPLWMKEEEDWWQFEPRNANLSFSSHFRCVLCKQSWYDRGWGSPVCCVCRAEGLNFKHL